MNLDLIKNNTKWEDAANSINSNFNKTNLELTKIAASSVKHKGYFTTEAALLAAQPSPKVGDNAYVGATYPGVVYICNTAGMWTATTTVPSPPAVNISEYYKKTETDAIVATVESNINSLETDLNGKLTELESKVDDINTILDGSNEINIEVTRGSGGIYASGGAAPTKTDYGISGRVSVSKGDILIYDIYARSTYAIAVKSKLNEQGDFLGYLPLSPALNGSTEAVTHEQGEYVFTEDCEVTLCCYTKDDTPYSFVIKTSGEALPDSVARIEETKADKKSLSTLSKIGDLSDHFSSPFDCIITGVSGNPSARYDFNVPLKEHFNIRFKFRITENVFNKYNARTIMSINDIPLLKATPVEMTQVTEPYTDESGAEQTSKWAAMTGGIKFLGSYTFDDDNSMVTSANINNIGNYALSIKYLGDPSINTAQVKVTSSSLAIMINGQPTAYSFVDYPTMESLYLALKQNTDIELDYNEIEGRMSNELAVFPYMSLVSKFHRSIDGGSQGVGELVYFHDAAPLHIPYAIDNRWHQAELTEHEGKYYLCVDGFFEEVDLSITDTTRLALGGDCGVLFKDLEIDTDTSRDAEIREYVWTIVSDGSQKKTKAFVSSVCPYIALFEVHGMIEGASCEATQTDKNNIECSADRIQFVQSILQQRGYVPITMKDITEWLLGNVELPRLCYSFMFDDWRWDNFLNLKKRSVFTRCGLKSALAVITDGAAQSIVYDGEEITREKAIQIGMNCGFSFYSHTYNHRKVDYRKPSVMAEEALQDIYHGDRFGIDPSIIIYPYGRNNTYSRNTMQFLGFAGGVTVPRKYTIRKCTNRYSIPRIYLELNQTTEAILGELI